jgi:membrane protease YdiL (CAAX protease family)
MTERHTTFPSALEAFFLVLCLWAINDLVSWSLYDARSWLALEDGSGRCVIAAVLANGIIFTALLQWKNLSYRDLFHCSRSATAARVACAVPLVLFATPFFYLVANALNDLLQAAFPMKAGLQEQFRAMNALSLPQIVAVCVLAPVLEEMLFRGIILRAFLQQYERDYAILGSAVVFGFAHGNMYQLVFAGLFGLAAGWLYERTRSLIPSIAMHAAVNAASTAWVAMAGSNAGAPNAASWVLAALLALPACYVLRRFLAAPAR